MAKQKMLNGMFSHINKEDMEVTVKCDFVALNVKLELEHSMKKEVVKITTGWPKKQQLSCLRQKWKNMKMDQHQKRFVPFLWDPIYALMKQHKSLKHVLCYL
jgi:hypothetical protein